MDVQDAEILLEAVAEESAAQVKQDPEFLVHDLQGDEVVFGDARVQVAFADPGVLG